MLWNVTSSGGGGSTMRLTAAAKPAADLLGGLIMRLCPVALVVGITCPVFNICLAKGIIGDYKKDAPPPADLKKKQQTQTVPFVSHAHVGHVFAVKSPCLFRVIRH